MRRLGSLAVLVALTAVLAGCAKPGQNTYGYREVGQAVTVDFATVVQARPVEIKGPNTGAGAVLGGAAGAALGSQIGKGSGSVAAGVIGGLLGLAAGAAAEQSIQDQVGIEYTVTTTAGVTKTVVQYQNKNDVVFRPGDRVMVQTGGNFMRVLPADQLPTEIDRPQDIKVRDPVPAKRTS
jgi:outer membrane lipoprotein SlyB